MSDLPRKVTVELFRQKKIGISVGAWAKPPQWYWRARGANGEILCQSEGYARKMDAAATALLVTGLVPDEPK